VVLATFARRVLEPLLCLPPTVDGVAERFGAIGVTNERGNERLAVAPGVDCSYRNATQTRFGDCPAQGRRSARWNRRFPQLWPGTASTLCCRSRSDSPWTGPVMDSAHVRPAGRRLGRAPRRLRSGCRGPLLLVGALGPAMTTHQHHRHHDQPHHPRHEDEGREGDRDEDVRIHLLRH